MPYEWQQEDNRDGMRAWPHRSLPRRGFVWFIGVTAVLLSLPLIAVLGSAILWALLPFMLGAIGAICCEFGFPQEIIRGFGVMARAIGLVGHILEETRNPMAFELWQRAEEEILETSGPLAAAGDKG